MRPRIDIVYRSTPAAKIVFDYEIHDPEDETMLATGHSVQVFMDTNYQLVLYSPEFYDEWRKRWGVFEGIK
jgi:acyl-CoA thioester hydrolase